MTSEPSSTSRVLVIDDSAVARTTIVEILSAAGYVVYSLPSAIGATRMIYQHAIGVVLVDLGMPGLSGDKLIGLIRNNPRLKDLVLVVVSGESEQELARLEAEGFVDAVIPKRDASLRLLGELRRVRLARALDDRPTPVQGQPRWAAPLSTGKATST